MFQAVAFVVTVSLIFAFKVTVNFFANAQAIKTQKKPLKLHYFELKIENS